MKGPFSSTAGRTAATTARLDTLCPESPLQLASPPGTPLFLTSLSFPFMPGSHQDTGTSVGKGSLSQLSEGSNSSAEGQGQPLPSVQELPTSFKTRGAVGGGIVEQCGACPPLPSGGVDKGRGTRGHRDAGQIAHPGGPEYALHPADGTQPGGNDPHPATPIPSVPLWHAWQPQSLPSPPLLALRGEGGPLQVGQVTGGSVFPPLGAVCGSRSVLPLRACAGHRVVTPLSGSSVGGHSCAFWD